MMIIGKRILVAKTDTGPKTVEVRMYLPTQDRSWYCRYEIDWPEETIRSFAQGNDALHAIHLAPIKIGATIYMSRYHEQRDLSWNDDWEGYGFPIPKNGRDLLIGQDAEYYGA